MRRITSVCCLGLFVASVALAQSGDEVPFITTPDHVTLAMLKLADVQARDFVLDLGSGDGRIVITAARRFGARGQGVEIVPELVERSRINAGKAGVGSRTGFAVQDLFETDLTRASVITMYLLPEVNMQLRPKLLTLKPGTRIVSHDWDMGDWPSDRSLTLEVPKKVVGREKLSRVHLWVVPADAHGLWCAPGAALRLKQQYQFVQGRLEVGGSAWSVTGRLDGTQLRLDGGRAPGVNGQVAADHLRLHGHGIARRWQRSTGTQCPASSQALSTTDKP